MKTSFTLSVWESIELSDFSYTDSSGKYYFLVQTTHTARLRLSS